jgi:hypothetical protein
MDSLIDKSSANISPIARIEGSAAEAAMADIRHEIFDGMTRRDGTPTAQRLLCCTMSQSARSAKLVQSLFKRIQNLFKT